MPWFFPWSDGIKKRSCRYLLQRYLGQFLEEKLTLDQLSVDLYNGIGSVTDVSLDVQALNDLGEQHNWPIEFVDGFIAEISVSIPWSSLLNESSSVEVHGLNLVIQPKARSDCATSSVFESMWSSMTSSMQLAEECLKQTEQEQEPTNIVNGVEEFAKTIDSILTRVRLKFIDSIIRLEHLPKESSTGVAIEAHIKEFSYYDETSTEESEESATKLSSAYSTKMFSFEGVEFYSNEFLASNRTICRSLLSESISGENDIFEKKISHHDIITIGKLLGKQEIRMKVKQKENFTGPKVDLEMSFSSLVMFLSPRQLRTIAELIGGLMSPHLQDTSNVVSRSRYNQKPMTSFDFERVEQELTQQINPTNLNTFVSKSLQNATGWSTGGIEDESDDDFHPVKGHACNSLTSSVANSVSSSYGSSVSSYQYSNKMYEAYGSSQTRPHHSKHKEKGGASEPDFSGDISVFQLRLNFLTVILLHQDILVTQNESDLPSPDLVEEMKNIANQFFTKYISLTASCGGRGDFHNARNVLQKAIPDRNHFRLYCTTNTLNAEEKSNSMILEIRGSLTMANVELIECLMELDDNKNEFVELVCFNRHDNFTANESAGVFCQPDVNIHFKHFNNSKHFSTPSKTELTVNLQDLRSELDVTIIDRLSDIIDNFHLLMNSLDKFAERSKPIFNDVVTNSAVESKFEWKICTPFLVLKLRFPVPNLRSELLPERSYWHKREVYGDILFVELSETSFQNMSGHQLTQNYEMQCKSVRVLFQEANSDKPIPFVLSEVDEKFGMSLPNDGRGFGWPRMVLRIYPKVGYIELEEEMDDGPETLMAQSIMQTQKQEPSPFTNKMIMRESDTSHLRDNNPSHSKESDPQSSRSGSNSEAEEIILPGSKEEIGEFIEDASHNALLQVDVTLPSVTIQIPSKHFYEVIYNRFSTDLALWKPRSSNKTSSSHFKDFGGQNVNLNFNHSPSMFTSFSMCKSTAQNHTDSEEEDDTHDNLLYSDEKVSPEQKNKPSGPQQSQIAISLFAAHGVLDVFPHARESSGKVIPGQFGEIQLLFNEANLFYVCGYKGEPLLNYVCLQINHISLYHCSLIPNNCEISLKSVDSYPTKYVIPTIYKSSSGAVINENGSPVGVGSTTSDDMLTLAVRVEGQENRFKNICVANSLNGITIRHRMKQPYTSWLSQLLDFFDVIDYPIAHYQPWKVMTALHQQLLNCVIDYRPINLPLRAALAVENFNISSNITSKTPTSILRFIAEEASLFISNKNCDKGDQPEDLSIDLRNDYVCVVDLGLFELSLRLTDKGDGDPQTDLRASNNMVHIRTCADSAVALMDLVKYIASDGDLADTTVEDDSSSVKKPPTSEDVLVNFKPEKVVENVNAAPRMNLGDIAETDEGVHQLVEEAINDTIVFKPNKRRSTYPRREDPSKVEMFFFPDEEMTSYTSEVSHTYTDSQSSEDDLDEFIMLDKEIGIGYMGQSSVPEVRLLTKEQIRVVDNHFNVPVSKVDDLKAPKTYPDAVSKYTLREMTVVWHMYGGHDFNKPDSSPESSAVKKQVTIVSDKGSNQDLSSIAENRRLSRNSSVDSINIMYSAKSNDLQSVNFVIPRSSPRLNDSFQNDSPNVLYDRQKSLSWQAQGGPNRQHDTLMELRLAKLKYQYEIYPKNTKQASRQVLLVQEVEIRDRMASSNINKFLYLYSSSARPKQSHANMVVIKATNIRPEANVHHYQECCLRVSLLPLRLNIDQDSLLFLINFFSEITGGSKEEEVPPGGNSTPPKPPQPIMNIENVNVDDSSSLMVQVDENQSSDVPTSSNSPIFIKSFIFSPDVPIRLDYEGKRVDMSHGPLAGLIMGLGQLNCSELKLKKLCNRQGILGIDKLITHVLTEWLQDIKKNQLPSILGGVGPMYSLVQLFQGIRDLFWLPIEQYQKDGRIIRGLQRGANSFSTSTAMAALELTARIVYAIQRIAETAFDIVSPGPSIRQLRYYERTQGNKNDHRKNRRLQRYSQPADIREGVATALLLVKEGFGETAQTLVRTASIEHEVKGTVGAVGSVIRQIPSTALKPIILASQATSNVLDGVRSQLVPDARAEAALKWRNDYF
ncbi:autophagy-related protein 2 homolog A [Planococcus citri]|uniref:autophagy-related protein 2 homolog A n=1 Tax=Planococcus citri TaxID=170843 RepID=UPI0031F8ED1C